MADTPKTPFRPGTEFLKNSAGVIHDVEPTHPAVELALKGEGWRFASEAEIRDYCALNNIEVPDFSTYERDIKKAKTAAQNP